MPAKIICFPKRARIFFDDNDDDMGWIWISKTTKIKIIFVKIVRGSSLLKWWWWWQKIETTEKTLVVRVWCNKYFFLGTIIIRNHYRIMIIDIYIYFDFYVFQLFFWLTIIIIIIWISISFLLLIRLWK